MKKILFTTIVLLFSISWIHAQESESKEVEKDKLYIELKDGAKPTIYVDDKIFDFPMELIDQDKIASVFAFKGKQAIDKYNAPNGVIVIKTKYYEIAATHSLEVKNLQTGGVSKFEIKGNNKIVDDKNAPMIIVDGTVVDRKTLDKLSPSTIDKMEVLKGEEALKQYDAPNGVIIITTKKM